MIPQQSAQKETSPADGVADDILQGADAIAAFLGITRRQVYHVAEKGGMPIRNIPGLGLVARKSRLLQALDAGEPSVQKRRRRA